MPRSPDVQQAQSFLDPLAGRQLVECAYKSGLEFGFGPPGFPRLIITTSVTITESGTAYTTDAEDDELVFGTVPGLVNQAVDVTVAADGRLTLRFAGGTTLTVPPDENHEAWELRDDDGLLLACMPGGGLTVAAPDQPDVAPAFTLDGPHGVKWIIGPLSGPYGEHSPPGRVRLRHGRAHLARGRERGRGYVSRSQVEVQASGLVAHTTATLAGDGPLNLAEFIADLAANWRGWAGERRWMSLEGEMEIEASHDGRTHVLIAVTIRRPQVTLAKDAWSARVVFILEAGEQLTSLARDLASVLAV